MKKIIASILSIILLLSCIPVIPASAATDYTSLLEVTSFKSTGKTSYSAAFQWDKNSNADGYILELWQYKNGRYPEMIKSHTLSANVITSDKFEGIDGGAIFLGSIRAYKKVDGTTYYGTYTTVEYSTYNTYETKGFINYITTTSAQINWISNTQATYCVIEVYDKKTGVSKKYSLDVKYIGSENHNKKLDGLSSGHSYTCTVSEYIDARCISKVAENTFDFVTYK